ncbi:flagellar export chaperone FliS [Chitinibacter fontanus]|uniref:Flagellar secretion chaperone FliS n=1 Tax=Chitinibacter fontanus TaxID=1737446 RepID=A0A7D5Z8Y7_9NEIS|nr:flagellar export chaperone FliS [Chitinibacter fontanus]QLI80126.1 flagellar export chaperone FliS [Chitinibacter fontanus]
MSAQVRRAMAAYSSQSLDADVNTASPHRLIVLLYDGAIKAVTIAKLHMQNMNIGEKGAAISKAISIIEEGLRLSLDRESGGELAQNLDALYEYIAYLLLEANIQNDIEKLDTALSLLKDLKESWDSIALEVQQNHQAGQEQMVQYGSI